MSADSLWSVTPALIVLAGAVAALVFALFAPRGAQPGTALITLAALAAAAAACLLLLRVPARLAFAGTFAADPACIYVQLVVIAATGIVVLLSVQWFNSDPRQGEYQTLLLMSALGALLLAGAADLMEMLLGVLLSSATGYVLAAYHRRSRRSAEASIKYYLLGALTSGVMVYGVVLLFGMAGSTTYSALAALPRGTPSVVLVVGSTLVLIGLAFKLGAVPAHAWMPDVADGAPAPVAAFLTAVPKAGALLALARLAMVLPDQSTGWRAVVALLAAATMTLGNLAALWQDDVRRLLGWSAVSQTGYGLLAVVALGRSPLALPALVLFLVAYVAGNLAAFGAVIALGGEPSRAQYAGLGQTRPYVAATLVVAFLSFIGIPPLAGFGAKLALFGAAIDAGYGWLAVLAIVNTVISLAYYARVIGPMYFEPAGGPAAGHRPGRLVYAGVAMAVLAVVIFGVMAESVLGGVRGSQLLPG